MVFCYSSIKQMKKVYFLFFFFLFFSVFSNIFTMAMHYFHNLKVWSKIISTLKKRGKLSTQEEAILSEVHTLWFCVLFPPYFIVVLFLKCYPCLLSDLSVATSTRFWNTFREGLLWQTKIKSSYCTFVYMHVFSICSFCLFPSLQTKRHR